MDYLCAKVGDFSFSRFLFYLADKQTHTHTQNYTQTPLTTLLPRLSSERVMDTYIGC